MTRDPKGIGPDELVTRALQRMEDSRITSLFVCDPDRRIEGLVHLHDLWRLDLF